ncbi:glycosyltransferase family 2 protein [Arthrobacter sp. JSM 101049]|uniref:glycosyltransferase family 2 protein n=1 Tax=Arthrobacter sp. JSM 101049 TaxID=929097 RepID=UPI003565BDAC
MDHQPHVSIIVPAKDQAPFIADALASLTRQHADPRDLEVLLVDDGSTDGTGELAAAFAGRLPGLRILRNETPTGVANARNQGLRAATAPLVGFLDPDDWYAPGHLPALQTALRQLDVDFVRCDHIRVVHGNRTLHRPPQARRNTALDPRDDVDPVQEASMVDYCYVWAGLFRRSFLERVDGWFPGGMHTAEDRAWTWKLHLAGGSYAVVDAPGVFYRRGVGTSLTQVYDARQLDFVPCYLDIFRQVAASGDPDRFWPKAARQFHAIASHHLKRSPGMDPRLRARLREGISTALDALPAQVRWDSLMLLDGPRRNALLPLAGWPDTAYLPAGGLLSRFRVPTSRVVGA